MARREKKPDLTGIIRNKKLPILTLDTRWHELFPMELKTAMIRELEQKVNNLLKRQGKLVNDIKDMKQLKNNLLKDIVENMDVTQDLIGKAKEKRLGKNKRYISELNEKIDDAMEELAQIPYQIKSVNEELLSESIQTFYMQYEGNRQEIEEVSEWIDRIREELKNKILLKQDLEDKNSKIYTYMHDILGAEIMELFDREREKINK